MPAPPARPVHPADDLAQHVAAPAAPAASQPQDLPNTAIDLPAADHAHTPPAPGQSYGQRADLLALADAIAARNGLDPQWVRDLLSHASYQAAAAQLIMPAPMGMLKNWSAYRGRFVEPGHIEAGVKFWEQQQRWLRLAEKRYGVPASVIVGLIGVETDYGRIMGDYRLLDVLTTLSLDFPTGRSDRSAFFRSELEQWVLLIHEHDGGLVNDRGSYAGAIGLAQFMPSSWRRYAVDFDGDGRIDLMHDPADVIGSVAHYLAQFGWQRGLPSRFAMTAPDDTLTLARLLAPDIVPTFSPRALREQGVTLEPSAQAFEGLLAVVALPNGYDPASYVAATHNFYVITRYNHSAMYAMAVIELGEAVANSRPLMEQDALLDKGLTG